jgi:hypothetical protein
MPRRFVLFAFASLLLCASNANAQKTHQFLGPPHEVPDQFTVKYGIRYNTQGYDHPDVNWNRKIRKWKANDVPDAIINEIMAFPGSPDTIGQWVDDAFEKTLAQFAACGGTLAERASKVSARDVYVTIMPSAFYEPYYDVLVAGAYYPTPKEIKVLNIYYIWQGEHRGWLRHARDLLVYEMGNYFAVACGIVPEPRSAAWPCDAPFVITTQ